MRRIKKLWMDGQINIRQAAKKKYIFIMKLKGKFWSPAVCLQYVLPHEPLLSILNSRPNDDFDIWWPYFNTFPHQITKRKIRPKLERRGHVFIHTWADFLFVCNRGDTLKYHSGDRPSPLLLVFLTPRLGLSSHPRQQMVWLRNNITSKIKWE